MHHTTLFNMKLTAITILSALGVTSAQLECREFIFFFIVWYHSFCNDSLLSKTNANVALPILTANSIDLESWTEMDDLQSGLTFKYAVVVSRACNVYRCLV